MGLNEKLVSLLKQSDINPENIESCSSTKFKEFLSHLNQYLDEKKIEDTKTHDELKKFRAVIDTTPSTISWINSNLEYIGLNKAMIKILPYPEAHYIGQKVGHHTKDDYFTQFAKDLFKSNENILYRELTTKVDGQKEKHFWIVGSQYDHGNEAVIIGIDITELKVLQDQFETQEKMAVIGIMAAGMAHEIKNPLSVIKNSAELIRLKMEKGNLSKEKLLKMLESVEKNSDRINKIVKGLQSFSRHSESDPFVMTSLYPLVEESVSLCNDKLIKTNVKIDFEGFPKKLEAICRGGEITQVLVNFINNAIDAIENLSEKWIKIEGEVINNMVKISVMDSGDGIPPEIKNKIFEAFYTTKPMGKGTGLGLSICKGIIENHQGQLDIETHAPHTTFTFTLPISQ